jgi:hypothetical protein
VFSRFFTILSLLLISSSLVNAQSVSIQGRFLSDSIKIGEQVPYSLTARYPSSLNLVFPDSTFSFAPFEIQKKKYFPTLSKNNISFDSTVYFLTTFEIDSIQTLSLPVFSIHAKDCTAFYSTTDTIFLKQLIKAVPDSIAAQELPLKTNTTYQNVRWLLNYWVIIIVTGVLLLSSIIVWVIFGKRIKKYFVLRRLQRKHNSFLQQFSKSAERLRSGFTVNHAENVLVVWKGYMEELLAQPFTTATSREILLREKDEALGNALQSVDRMIYKSNDSYSEEAITSLNQYAQKRFINKVEEIKHG